MGGGGFCIYLFIFIYIVGVFLGYFNVFYLLF